MEHLNSLFKEKSLKVTPQRYAIYKYLNSTQSHPSAESIYEELKVNYPTMSLATVYKTLRTLIEIGLVQEINVGEDNFRYDANVDTHPHLICKSCSRVDDIENQNFAHINMEVQKLTTYKIEDCKLYFYGICPECQKEGR